MGEVIRARLAARPFVPFRLVVTGGSVHDVTEPDLAVLGENAVVTLFARPPGRPNGRTLRAIIAIPHIVMIEVD